MAVYITYEFSHFPSDPWDYKAVVRLDFDLRDFGGGTKTHVFKCRHTRFIR